MRNPHHHNNSRAISPGPAGRNNPNNQNHCCSCNNCTYSNEKDYYMSCECTSCRNLGNSIDICCQCCSCNEYPRYSVTSMAMQEDTLEVCLQQATDGSNVQVDMDDIALAHAHAAAEQQRALQCHECHPPAPPPPPPACCPHSRTGPPAHQAVPQQHGGQHAGHRPVFHGWQQQMRARAAAQQQKQICARGKPWNGFEKIVEIPEYPFRNTRI